ncbi:MAG: DUF47 domain-containing protein [Chloroflexota bacterium]
MPISLVPKERQFFVLFREEASNLRQSLGLLNQLLHSQPDAFAALCSKLRDLEHAADETTHQTMHELNKTFITPFDREDIYALASTLDDVVDLAEETADTIVIDRVGDITSEAQQMGDILVQIAGELVQAIDQLDTRKNIEQHWVKVHDLENDGDRVIRRAIGALFECKDPVYIIKWKDVYALLEKTIDTTEHVAHILESITIKNA